MMDFEREFQAQNAINQFVQYSCAFIVPGTQGRIASEVGSGVLIATKGGHLTVLTAKHVAEGARAEGLLTVLRYIERNPLRAGLVAQAEDWRWSSLKHWRNARTVQ